MRALWWLVPVVVGVLQPVIWGANLRVGRATGEMEAATALHAVGAVVGLAWVLVGLRGSGFGGLATLPWWAWLGGGIGVSCLAATARAMPVVGVSGALALLVASQFTSTMVVEHYGWLGLDRQPVQLSRLCGAGLLAVGAWLVSR